MEVFGVENKEVKQEKFLKGSLIGLVVAIVLGIAYSFFTYYTEWRFGFINIFIGAAIGKAIQHFGQGKSLKFSLMAVALCVVSMLLSDFMLVYLVVQDIAYGSMNVLQLTFELLPELYTELDFIDIILYGIAVITAFQSAKE